jgi:hypothetical protein
LYCLPPDSKSMSRLTKRVGASARGPCDVHVANSVHSPDSVVQVDLAVDHVGPGRRVGVCRWYDASEKACQTSVACRSAGPRLAGVSPLSVTLSLPDSTPASAYLICHRPSCLPRRSPRSIRNPSAHSDALYMSTPLASPYRPRSPSSPALR